MATKIYESATIELVDGTEIYVTPLKIKFLREFMEFFDNRDKNKDGDLIDHLLECTAICMRQLYPSIKTSADVADNIDMESMYTVLDICAGIKFKKNMNDEEVSERDLDKEENHWEKMDLASLEAEAFLIGIWKDFEELERSLSMQELSAIVNKRREQDYSDKKFFAAIQGVDLDKESGKQKDDPWEAMKRRVFGGQKSSDPNDVTNLRGKNAVQAGFGIGMGLDYQEIR